MPGGSTGFRVIFSALTSLGAERPFTRPPILRTSEPEGSLSPSWMDTCIRGVSHQFQQHFAYVYCAAFGGILKGSGAICERNPGLFPKGIRGNPGESGGIRHLFGILEYYETIKKTSFRQNMLGESSARATCVYNTKKRVSVGGQLRASGAPVVLEFYKGLFLAVLEF